MGKRKNTTERVLERWDAARHIAATILAEQSRVADIDAILANLQVERAECVKRIEGGTINLARLLGMEDE